MRRVSERTLSAIAAALALFLPACQTQTTPAPSEELSEYALEYRLLAAYPDFFWCDPDVYPVGGLDQEARNSIEQFPMIRANAPEFAAILDQLMLPDQPDYTAEEKLLIYREHKKLTYVIRMTPADDEFEYGLRTTEDQGLCIEGTISLQGKIKESARETCFNNCPICLTEGTRIETPIGPVRVEEVTIGAVIWTMDEMGHRTTARVIDSSATPVPPGFEVVKVTLADGRTVSASPGHPTSDGRSLGGLQVGEILDGAPVASVERVPYEGGFTYDIRPAGPTGFYWANRVLVKSTLVTDARP